MGLLFILIAVIFDANGTNWFSGETGVQHACYWIGFVLIALQVVLMLLVGGIGLLGVSAASRKSRRF